MTEEKKEEEEGSGLGYMAIVFLVVVSICIALVVYNWSSGPYRTAEQLRERLDEKVNRSEDYRQGWLDCIKNYLEIAIGPHNATSK